MPTTRASQTLEERAAMEVVSDHLAAYNAHDAKTFAAFFHEDAEILGADGNDFSLYGRDEIQKRYEQTFADTPDTQVQILEMKAVGERVYVHARFTGLDGDRKFLYLLIYDLDRDQIQQAWFYADIEEGV